MRLLKLLSLCVLMLFVAACRSHDPGVAQTLASQPFTSHQQKALAELQAQLPARVAMPVDDSSDTPLLLLSSAAQDVVSIDSADMLQTLAWQTSPYITRILLELGIHEAERVQRSLPRNPELALSLMRPENGGRWQLELSLSFGLLEWLARQRRLEVASSEKIHWQMQAWQQLDTELTLLRQLWLDAISENNKLSIYKDLLESSNVSAELSQLLFDAGNVSELELLTNQSVAAQRHARLLEAELSAAQAMTRLAARLGLEHTQQIQLPPRFPEPQPATRLPPDSLNRLLQSAAHYQPAMQLAKARHQQQHAELAQALQHQQLRNAGLQLSTERESNGEREHGVGLSLSLPVFDSGDTRISQLQGQLLDSDQRQHILQTELSADISQALLQFDTSLALLQTLQDEDLPRLRQMMTLAVREYNFMLRGTFELLNLTDLTLNARLRQLQATQQYWQAVFRLEQLAGQSLTQALSLPSLP